jgi:hypothetical protein
VTLILSLVTAGYALQVSDRLLTQQAGNEFIPWDPLANKSLILLARDALVTMGYSGPGHISGATTDGWIAEALSGQYLGADRSRPTIGSMHLGFSLDRNRLLFDTLDRLIDRLNDAMQSGALGKGLRVDYVGLQAQELPAEEWPIFGGVAWDGSQNAYMAGVSKRHWGWESGNSWIQALGRSQKRALSMLNDRFASPGVDLSSIYEASSTLLDVLRSIPPQDPSVGRDCMITTIQRSPPEVHVRYEPYELRERSVNFTGGGRRHTITVPAAYTPWIITPWRIAAPQMISGAGSTFDDGGFDWTVEPPDTAGDLMIQSSERRRLWPP